MDIDFEVLDASLDPWPYGPVWQQGAFIEFEPSALSKLCLDWEECDADWGEPVRLRVAAILMRDVVVVFEQKIGVRHPHGSDEPIPPHLNIELQQTPQSSEVLDDLLCLLEVDPDHASVHLSPKFPLQPWRVMRQDDNGHEFEVVRCSSKAAAQAQVRLYEARAHKQHYWTERS